MFKQIHTRLGRNSYVPLEANNQNVTAKRFASMVSTKYGKQSKKMQEVVVNTKCDCWLRSLGEG